MSHHLISGNGARVDRSLDCVAIDVIGGDDYERRRPGPVAPGVERREVASQPDRLHQRAHLGLADSVDETFDPVYGSGKREDDLGEAFRVDWSVAAVHPTHEPVLVPMVMIVFYPTGFDFIADYVVGGSAADDDGERYVGLHSLDDANRGKPLSYEVTHFVYSSSICDVDLGVGCQHRVDRRNQVVANLTARASVGEADLIRGDADDQFAVDVDITKIVDQNGDAQAMVFRQDPVSEGCLPAPRKPVRTVTGVSERPSPMSSVGAVSRHSISASNSDSLGMGWPSMGRIDVASLSSTQANVAERPMTRPAWPSW